MTSNDRHASHDSPYRTGEHVPLPQSRHAPLTSVATSAMESRTDFNSPYAQDEPSASNGFIGSPKGPMSPQTPYSPGMKSALQRQSSDENGEIQMQNFADGLPPPPPVGHSWKRIDRWAEDNFVELFDNMCEGATHNDVNELEHVLDCTLPMEVRESLQIHDGQERGGLPTGVIFGCMLLDCEEIVMEWSNWRVVNEEYLSTSQSNFQTPQIPIKAFAGPSSSTAPPLATQAPNSPLWRQDLLTRQDSQPPNAIQKAYAHPAWIPLARDWGGNCLAVDLAPGPAGKWGQVIIFGRDYDCKYVVSRSWAAFLATLADDLASEHCFVDEESSDLKFKPFKKQNVEPTYLEILRWRTDQKYGRKPPKKRPNSGLHINSNVATNGTSPYGSPGSNGEERGRSPHRFSGSGKSAAAPSPRAAISSPLARVTEEPPQPAKAPTEEEKLLELNTPRASQDLNSAAGNGSGKNSPEGSDKGKGKTTVIAEEMKEVEI
ncbi:putative 1,3-beta-glucan biosynthesis protein [Saccharata proteae CBS 121410]|uniref:1,3-beta-glucan biosynthesis protein n=1 Tax=Saccharata proteae CBS 121410 TaxID=1314787 RepID=A0A9P4HVU0_9PEZI|nr:putative 1,3-beta-glucan biosynthesis protein [Saccharata proteae CBS 121410]